MLIYNDQKEFAHRRIEEAYGVLIPEDNFWRQLNNRVDFSSIGVLLEKVYKGTTKKTAKDFIRMFKCLLLKSYYNLSIDILVENLKTNFTYRYFLEYDPLEMDTFEPNDLEEFARIPLSNGELFPWIFSVTSLLAEEKNASLDTLVTAGPKNDETIGAAAEIFLSNMKKILEP